MARFAYDHLTSAEDVLSRRQLDAGQSSVQCPPGAGAFWNVPLPTTARDDQGNRMGSLTLAADFLRRMACDQRNAMAWQLATEALRRAARTGAPGDVAAASLRLEQYLVLYRQV